MKYKGTLQHIDAGDDAFLDKTPQETVEARLMIEYLEPDNSAHFHLCY